MPRHHATTDATRRLTPPEHTPRLRLKPRAPHTGYVDGAWWPHSDDLTIELPDLLAVLAVRLGPIDRVVYKAGDWAEAAVQSHRAPPVPDERNAEIAKLFRGEIVSP